MRILADENIPMSVIDWLRSTGHDVVAVAIEYYSEEDEPLLSIAESDERIVLTADKGFGALVFLRRRLSHGIVLLRLETLPLVRPLD
jgi:predicted nuclease of predicted toxin-antitoxin system